MSENRISVVRASDSKLFYGWVVVGVGLVMIAVNGAIIFSFGVFFKPLAADFGLTRATTSAIQSLFLICLAIFGVLAGWLADRFGSARTLGICGFLVGLGLFLTSQVKTPQQIFFTYSFVTGVGVSGIFPIANATTAAWFVKRRGLALGIASAGSGVGMLVGVPIIARLIAVFSWSRTYLVLGIASFALISIGAFLLRRKPEEKGLGPYSGEAQLAERRNSSPETNRLIKSGPVVALSAAIRTKTLWMLVGIFFLFSTSNSMVTVHLVNYATDMDIAPFIAATLMSALGLSSLTGRLLMGAASDRIGNLNTLIFSCLLMVPSLIWLVFAQELWMLYMFAFIYGFGFGAEVPQQAALIGKYFGLRVVLVAMMTSSAYVGAALGSWVGGRVFDLTQSYHIAFLIAVAAIGSALLGTLILKRRDRMVATARG